MKRATIPESAVLNACLQYLVISHIDAWRNNSGAYKIPNQAGGARFIRFGRPGSADIIGLLPNGRFLAVECKSDVGELSKQQQEFRRDIERNHGVYILARSIDDLAAGLREAMK